jgi:hypothetical protein
LCANTDERRQLLKEWQFERDKQPQPGSILIADDATEYIQLVKAK